MFSLRLPEGVVSYFTSDIISQEILFKEELELCQKYEPSRLLDFVRGRYCAHECLKEFEIQHRVSRNSEGVPLWPQGYVGSISHTIGVAGAIVGQNVDYVSLGLDIERVGRISENDWTVLFTKDEIKLLKDFPMSIQEEFSTLFYSAKETFYKLQFTLTGRGLEFDDVEVQVESDELLVTCRMLKNWKPVPIHFCMEQEYIVTYGIIKN